LAVGGQNTDDRGEALLTVPEEGLDLGELQVAANTLR
jgi:hypothetical protein